MLGLFIFIAGILSGLEVFGVINTGYKWFFPLIIACLGLAIMRVDWKDRNTKKQEEIGLDS